MNRPFTKPEVFAWNSRDSDSLSNQLMNHLGEGPSGSGKDGHEGFYEGQALPSLNVAIIQARTRVRGHIKKLYIGEDQPSHNFVHLASH